MADFNQVAVEARRNGVSCIDTAKLLYEMDPKASIEEVVYAFALAGYPATDNFSGSSYFSYVSTEERIVNKMREVKYPENEIEAARHQAKG